MKFCHHCGQELQDDTRFCSKCGTSCKDIPTPDPSQINSGNKPENITEPLNYEPNFQSDSPPLSNQPGYEIPIVPADFPTTPRRRWPLAVAGALLLILGGAYLLYILGNFSPPHSTKIAPADTSLYVCVKPNLLQLRSFNHLQEVFLSIPEVKAAWEKMQNQMKKEADIDFEKDIKPWLGKEAAYFMTDSNDPEKMVLAIEYRNETKTRSFLDKLYKKSNTDFKHETYHGITISSHSEFDYMGTAMVNNFLLLSDDEKALKETIDRAQGTNKNYLAQDPEYQKITKKLPWNHSAICYMNCSQLIDKSIPNELKTIEQQLGAYSSLGLSLSLQSNGIRGDYVLASEKGTVKENIKGNSASRENTLKILPANSLGFVRSSTLINILQNSMGTLESDRDIKRGLDEIQRETGINLKNDVLEILQGDIAVALTQREGDFLGQNQVPVGVVLAVGVTDEQKAISSTQKILRQLSDVVSYNEQNISGHKAFLVGERYDNSILGLGLKNKMLLIASSPELTKKVLGDNGTGLLGNKEYQQAMGDLPTSWNPDLYMNVSRSAELMEDTMSNYERKQYHDEILPWLRPIKSVGQVNSELQNGVTQGACFIRIEK